MRKRKREDSDVAGSPQTKIQGRSNFSHSTDPNVPEDVSVRKRRADDEGEVPQKKLRCSNLTDPTDHSEGPQEDESIQNGKRKACGDAGPLEEKTRCGITNTNGTDSSVVEDHLVGPVKRKASDEGEAPVKKQRLSDSSSSSGSSSRSSRSRSHSSNNNSNSSSNSGSIEKREDLSSDDDESDVSQTSSSASTEEDRIYQMSSVRKKRSQGKLTVGNKMSWLTWFRNL